MPNLDSTTEQMKAIISRLLEKKMHMRLSIMEMFLLNSVLKSSERLDVC